LHRNDLSELHYIVPIANLPSILARGLLSHRRVAVIDHLSVANEEVQVRRASRKLQTGRWLHEYVNLYFCARNTMLYFLVRTYLQSELSVLRISTDVLSVSGALVTDRNAASGIALVADPATGIARLDRDVVFAQSWIHEGDPDATYDHRQRMCAEVLVPDRIGPEYILGAYVADDRGKALLEAAAPGLVVTINARLFFR